MLIYIAAPYSQGDVVQNIRRALEAADQLIAKNHIPFVPHLSHLWHLISPKSYEEWLRIGLAWLGYCDAVLRLSGTSWGADKEVEFALRLGKPVYYSLGEVSRGGLT